VLAITLLVITILAATINYKDASGYEENVSIKIGSVFEILGVNCFTVTVSAEMDDELTLYTWMMLASKGNGRPHENYYYTPVELEADTPQNVTYCESEEILLKDSTILEALEE